MKIVLLIFLFVSIVIAQFEIECKLVDNYSYNCPKNFSVEFINSSDSAVYIWRPSDTFWWLWTIEVYKDDTNRFYIPRESVAWGEPKAILLSANSSFKDTVMIPIGSLYDTKCMKKHGCNPFIDADSMRLIYNFKGKLLPSENLTGIFIPEEKPIERITKSGNFRSNWIEVKCTESDINSYLSRKKANSGVDALLDVMTDSMIVRPCCDEKKSNH